MTLDEWQKVLAGRYAGLFHGIRVAETNALSGVFQISYRASGWVHVCGGSSAEEAVGKLDDAALVLCQYEEI